jgi:hypothetical protein
MERVFPGKDYPASRGEKATVSIDEKTGDGPKTRHQ